MPFVLLFEHRCIAIISIIFSGLIETNFFFRNYLYFRVLLQYLLFFDLHTDFSRPIQFKVISGQLNYLPNFLLLAMNCVERNFPSQVIMNIEFKSSNYRILFLIQSKNNISSIIERRLAALLQEKLEWRPSKPRKKPG